QRVVLRRLDTARQDLLGFAAQDGQHAMRGSRAHGFGPIEIVAVLCALLRLAAAHLRLQDASGPEEVSDALTRVGVVADAFGDDVACALQRIFDWSEKVGCFSSSIDTRVLAEDDLGQWLQTFF